MIQLKTTTTTTTTTTTIAIARTIKGGKNWTTNDKNPIKEPQA